MTTDHGIPPQEGGVFGMLLFIGICGVLATFVTNWIGLTAYPVPVLLSILAVGSFFHRKDDAYLSWRQWTVVWSGAALFAVATLVWVLSDDASPKPADPASYQPPVPTSESTLPVAPQSNEFPPAGQSAQPTDAPIQTSIDELLDAFATNQVAAAKKYGRPIQLTGKVVRVREAWGTGILILKSPTSGREHEFGFSDAGTKKLADIQSGQSVTITCPAALEAMSVVLVGGCSDIETK